MKRVQRRDQQTSFGTKGTAFRIGLVQLAVSTSKPDNLLRAAKLVQEATKGGAKLVALPECFNSPYGTKFFPQYAEPIPGETSNLLSKLATDNNIYLVGGSFPESENGKFYNTCLVHGPDGKLLAKYRKSHLFDINVPGKISFQESSILSPGDDLASFDTPECKVGIGICYDMRFAEMAQVYANKGCKLLIYPGAFNMTTGPAHWEAIQRGRALDNQVYFAAVSPATDRDAEYVAWGHSTVVDPWGTILAKAGHGEEVIYADIDLKKLGEIRQQIPIIKQKRPELYKS